MEKITPIQNKIFKAHMSAFNKGFEDCDIFHAIDAKKLKKGLLEGKISQPLWVLCFERMSITSQLMSSQFNVLSGKGIIDIRKSFKIALTNLGIL